MRDESPFYTRMHEALRLQFQAEPAQSFIMKFLFFTYGAITVLGGGLSAVDGFGFVPESPLSVVGYLALCLIFGYVELVITLFVLKLLWFLADE
jgi:hypothetical protein